MNSTTTLQNLDDTQLLKRLLLRNPKAWQEFHSRYDRLVYSCIHKVTQRFPNVGSVDLQEIYAQFLLNLHRRNMHKLRAYNPEKGARLSTWLGMIATNTAWDHLRRTSRRPETVPLSDVVQYRSEGRSPFESTLEQERWALLERTLSDFSARDQEFVRLFYVEAWDAEKIAEHLQISIKTVYSKKHKITARLRDRVRRSKAA